MGGMTFIIYAGERGAIQEEEYPGAPSGQIIRYRVLPWVGRNAALETN
jgi:hypothetical protein